MANTEEFMETNYNEILLFIKNDDLFAKEDMVIIFNLIIQ